MTGESIKTLRARLDESLFPAPSLAQATIGRGEYLLIAAGALALGVVLQLVRLGWSVSLDSLWAEDGPIFLQQALAQGSVDAIFSPYSNYLVVVPRLIGEAAVLVPLEDAPAAISILSAIVVSLSGLIVWHASAGHIHNVYLRATLAILTVLVPVAGLESISSASYVSWYMLFATFWILLWRPATLGGAIFAALFVLATALSNPGVWFFIPLAALRALAARDRRDMAMVASFAVGAAVQMLAFALSNDEVVEPLWTEDIWIAFLQRVLEGAAFGQRLGGVAWSHLGWPLLIVLLICGAVGLGVGIRRSTPTARYVTAIAVPTSLAMFVVATYQRAVGTEMMWPASTYNGNGGRYAIVPALLLVSAALVLLDGSSGGKPRLNPLRPATIVTMALLALAIVTSFDMRNTAARGESWSDALRRAASSCPTRSTAATVQTSPPGFAMSLSCDRILPFADDPPRR